jgi:hypothetical protein
MQSQVCKAAYAHLNLGVVASGEQSAGGIPQAHCDVQALSRCGGQADVHTIQEPCQACADQLQAKKPSSDTQQGLAEVQSWAFVA